MEFIDQLSLGLLNNLLNSSTSHFLHDFEPTIFYRAVEINRGIYKRPLYTLRRRKE